MRVEPFGGDLGEVGEIRAVSRRCATGGDYDGEDGQAEALQAAAFRVMPRRSTLCKG